MDTGCNADELRGLLTGESVQKDTHCVYDVLRVIMVTEIVE